MSTATARDTEFPETPTLGQLVSEYLRVLANERAASAHTLRAYERELAGFASFIVKNYGEAQSPARIETPTFAAILERCMTAVCPRRRRRGHWRPFGAGSNGWREQDAWSKTRLRWWPPRAFRSTCRACPQSNR